MTSPTTATSTPSSAPWTTSTRWSRAAHARDIKVIVDIVPNHTSDLHPWFREALAAEPGSAARERYIFRDGIGPDGDQPPSDWISHFGGPAWTRVPDGQWYCHLFAPEQPDLNWDNREVRDDFLDTLRFWADRGVDGFRVDVAHALAKDLVRAAAQQAARWRMRRCRWTAPTRSTTATRCTRSTREWRAGLRRLRPAADGRRRGVARRRSAAPSTPARPDSVRRSTSIC